MHAHAHTYLYAHIHTCTCINMHAHTNTCVHTYIYVPYTCVHIPLAGRCREAVTSRTVISRRPPYQHMPFGGPTGSHPKRRCWVQRSGGKVSKMAPSTGWRGQAERRFRPSVAVTVPSACQRAGSPPVGRRSPLRKMSSRGDLASLLQLLPQRAHPLDPQNPPFSKSGPLIPIGLPDSIPCRGFPGNRCPLGAAGIHFFISALVLQRGCRGGRSCGFCSPGASRPSPASLSSLPGPPDLSRGPLLPDVNGRQKISFCYVSNRPDILNLPLTNPEPYNDHLGNKA